MGRRAAFILIALFLIGVGTAGAYFALTVPNDVRAEALMREARTNLKENKRKEAREKLEQIVRDYPRTDAAAAALGATIRLDSEERDELLGKIATLETRQIEQQKRISSLESQIAEVSAAAKKAAEVKPPPPAPKKPTIAKKKPAPKRKTTTRRTTRRRR